MNSEDGFIDVQSHFLPPVYLKALERAGMDTIDGWQIPKWNIPIAVAAMDQLGISAQLISLTAPAVSFVKGQEARDLARTVNDYAAAAVQDQSPRFGAFAVLPLPDIEGSLSELSYALDTLKLDGIGLLSNYDGRYLGSPEFDPVFEEMNRRNAVLFIHPSAPPQFDLISNGLTPPILEYPFDTTRMATNLIRSGTVERCPNVKIILPHGGGAIPFLKPRLAFAVGPERAHLFSSFYYDLTAAAMPGQLAALATVVPPDKLLMGVDIPFMPAAINAGFLASLEKATFTDVERKQIRRENALKLFPRLAERLANVS